MSSVVGSELERNYEKLLDEQNLKLSKIIENAEHNQFSISSRLEFNKELSLNRLKQFYNTLQIEARLTILNYDNEFLPEIVRRSIHKIKPFSDSKTELKDAIIWLTYSRYAEKNGLPNCVFLTANVSDFCNIELLKADTYQIHNDLLLDSNKFKIYPSVKNLLQSEKKALQLADQRFRTWLSDQNINNEYVLDIIKNNFDDYINKTIRQKFENYDLWQLFDEDHYLTGYVTIGSCDVLYVEDIHVDIFRDECIISGDLYIDIEVDGYQYNSVRDPGEDRHTYYGSQTSSLAVVFSFSLDKEKGPNNFEINIIEVVGRD